MASGAKLRVSDIAEGTHQVYSGILLVLLHFSPNTSGYLLAILGHSAVLQQMSCKSSGYPYLGTVLVLQLCSISLTEATLAVCMKYLDFFCCHYRVLVDSVADFFFLQLHVSSADSSDTIRSTVWLYSFRKNNTCTTRGFR